MIRPPVHTNVILLVACIVAVLLGSCSTSQASRRHLAWQAAMQRATVRIQDARFGAAEDQYDIAWRLAETPRERAETLISYADLWTLPWAEPLDFDRMKEGGLKQRAIRLYEKAIREARRKQSLDTSLQELEARAINNLSVVLLELGRTTEARVRLKATLPKVRVAQLPGYLYNYGVALEKTDQIHEALEVFLQASTSQQALKHAERLVFDRQETGTPLNQIRFLQALIDGDQLHWASRILKKHRLLETACRDPEYCCQALRALADLLAKSSVDAQEFNAEWWHRIQNLPSARVNEMQVAYLEELPISLEPRTAEKIFGHWAEPYDSRSTFAALLRAIALQDYRNERYGRALSRFALAWALNPRDTDSGIYLLDLVTLTPYELSPAEDRLLESILERVCSTSILTSGYWELWSMAARNFSAHPSLLPGRCNSSNSGGKVPHTSG